MSEHPTATRPAATSPPPLPGDDVIARRQLPARSETYWRGQALLFTVPVLALLSVGAAFLPWWEQWLRWTLVAVVAAYLLAVEIVVAPRIRRAVFWYAVSTDEIEIEHGWVFRTRTVVPMNRVQHLDTNHGPLADRFGLANVHIHTAAGAVKMDALDRADADVLRKRISALAQLADDV